MHAKLSQSFFLVQIFIFSTAEKAFLSIIIYKTIIKHTHREISERNERFEFENSFWLHQDQKPVEKISHFE